MTEDNEEKHKLVSVSGHHVDNPLVRVDCVGNWHFDTAALDKPRLGERHVVGICSSDGKHWTIDEVAEIAHKQKLSDS